MILLGFADDVLDVRWRYKVWFPAIAGIPLMIFYYTNMGVTYVMLPMQLRPYLGDLIDLGTYMRRISNDIDSLNWIIYRTFLLRLYGNVDYFLYA